MSHAKMQLENISKPRSNEIADTDGSLSSIQHSPNLTALPRGGPVLRRGGVSPSQSAGIRFHDWPSAALVGGSHDDFLGRTADEAAGMTTIVRHAEKNRAGDEQ